MALYSSLNPKNEALFLAGICLNGFFRDRVLHDHTFFLVPSFGRSSNVTKTCEDAVTDIWPVFSCRVRVLAEPSCCPDLHSRDSSSRTNKGRPKACPSRLHTSCALRRAFSTAAAHTRLLHKSTDQHIAGPYLSSLGRKLVQLWVGIPRELVNDGPISDLP